MQRNKELEQCQRYYEVPYHETTGTVVVFEGKFSEKVEPIKVLGRFEPKPVRVYRLKLVLEPK